MIYKILCLGNQWRGSDDGSLFNAFQRNGHLISIIDHKMFLPSEERSFASKVVSKLFSMTFLMDFNNQILKSFDYFKPDIVCVYKGNRIFPSTLAKIKKMGIPIFCVYPDVSFFDHESNIPKLVPYYDYIFTTKSFGPKDIKEKFNFSNVSIIKHAIDPNIHRPLNISDIEFNNLKNDVSFIGSYSKKKENILKEIIVHNKNLDIKIWGGSWNLGLEPLVFNKYMKSVVYGDVYSIAIQKSKINLGLLSEIGKGSSSGDLITSRTFHIPGAGGFMIHERTDELLDIYSEGESVECFDSTEELNDKIKFYINNESIRKNIAIKGQEIVWKYHKSDDRAKEIIDILTENNIL